MMNRRHSKFMRNIVIFFSLSLMIHDVYSYGLYALEGYNLEPIVMLDSKGILSRIPHDDQFSKSWYEDTIKNKKSYRFIDSKGRKGRAQLSNTSRQYQQDCLSQMLPVAILRENKNYELEKGAFALATEQDSPIVLDTLQVRLLSKDDQKNIHDILHKALLKDMKKLTQRQFKSIRYHHVYSISSLDKKKEMIMGNLLLNVAKNQRASVFFIVQKKDDRYTIVFRDIDANITRDRLMDGQFTHLDSGALLPKFLGSYQDQNGEKIITHASSFEGKNYYIYAISEDGQQAQSMGHIYRYRCAY
jgi:hypothetical protein